MSLLFSAFDVLIYSNGFPKSSVFLFAKPSLAL